MSRGRNALRIIRAGAAMVLYGIAFIFEALAAVVEEDYKP